MTLVAVDSALLTAWLVGGSAARMLGASAVVLAAIALTAWQARRASRAAAREASRRAVEHAQRELLSGMSHELRTPLNSVIGFSSVLLRNCAGRLTSQELDYLERVRANGVQLLRVVDDGLARGATRAAGEPVTDRAAPR